MACCPITSWQIEEEKVEAAADFIFLGSKITANGDCSHEIKRRLLLGTKALTPWKKSSDKPRQCIKKQRHHFAKKCPYSQSCVFVFSLVTHGCESWAMKNAEHQRIDAFKLWC